MLVRHISTYPHNRTRNEYIKWNPISPGKGIYRVEPCETSASFLSFARANLDGVGRSALPGPWMGSRISSRKIGKNSSRNTNQAGKMKSSRENSKREIRVYQSRATPSPTLPGLYRVSQVSHKFEYKLCLETLQGFEFKLDLNCPTQGRQQAILAVR